MKNKIKKLWFIIPMIVLLVPLFLVGCMGDNPEQITAQDPPVKTSVFTQSMAEVQQTYATKGEVEGFATKGQVSDLSNRISNLEGQSSTNTYDKSELYTKSQVDARVREIIEQMIADGDLAESGSSGSSSSSSSSDHTDAEVIDDDGDLELCLDWVDPSSDPVYFQGSGDECEWGLIVVNNEDSSNRFKLSMRLSPEVNTTISEIEVECYPSLGNWTVSRSSFTGTTDVDTNHWTFTDPSPNDTDIYFEMDDWASIGDEDEDDYQISVFMKGSPSVYWNYRWYIEEK